MSPIFQKSPKFLNYSVSKLSSLSKMSLFFLNYPNLLKMSFSQISPPFSKKYFYFPKLPLLFTSSYKMCVNTKFKIVLNLLFSFLKSRLYHLNFPKKFHCVKSPKFPKISSISKSFWLSRLSSLSKKSSLSKTVLIFQ